MSRGWYKAWVLSVDGRPIAFRQGDVYGARLRLIAPGYDPEFAHYGVGNYLLGHIIEEGCADPDVQVIDFGLGDSESKRRFGTRSFPERDVIVYALTPRAVAINMARGLVMQLNGLAKSLLRRVGLYERMRRRSRGAHTG